MANAPISGLGALGAAPATGDLLVLVDISDSASPTGATKKMTVANLFTSPTFTGTTTAPTVNVGTLTITGASGINGTLLAVDGSGVSRRIALVFGTTVQVGALDAGWATDTTVGYQNNLYFYKWGVGNVGTFSSTGLLTVAGGLVVSSNGIVVTGDSSFTGAIFALTSITMSGAINGQTISSTASFTGTVSIVTSLTVTGGGITHHSATLLSTSTALTAGSTGASPIITQGPVSGNPTKWVSISDNGTTRWIPTWT